jgi:hypothetical protein
MAVSNSLEKINESEKRTRRFATLDFARGLAIFLMIALHTLSLALNKTELLADIDNLPLINLVALVIIPFYGGLAGLFLLVSSISNMVSMYRNHEKGTTIKNIVVKQVASGLLLLFFAMVCEAIIGYHGAVGNFFKMLDDPASYFDYNPAANYEHWEGAVDYNWQAILWRWNHFETINTIAWCLILNGLVQGALAKTIGWKNRKKIMIAYAVLAVVVVGLTKPVWELVKVILPGYPFEFIPETGNVAYTPVIGQDVWWRIITAPFLSTLAAPMEPIFPYLAVSFIGSIVGIEITKPKEERNKHFPRNMLLIGLGMFVVGTVGVILVIVRIIGTQDFDTAIEIYQLIPYHRHWSPDYQNYIPPFAWLAQFLCLNGYSLVLIMFLFRLIEYRGKSKSFSEKTKIMRRFGTVAFSNYSYQWLSFIVYFFTSWAITSKPYGKLFWGGTIVTIIAALGVYSLLLWGWEKINYVGSLEWMIRLIANNVIPARKERYGPEVNWWKKGEIEVEKIFYKPKWISLQNPGKEEEEKREEIIREQKKNSTFGLTLAIIGLVTVIFNAASIFGLFVTMDARKKEGKNKKNTAALVLSIIGCVAFVAFYVVCFTVKIGTLGLPI